MSAAPEDSLARETGWYDDLIVGSGAATGLSDSARRAIAEVTRARAEEYAQGVRAVVAEREAAAEAERRAVLERLAQERVAVDAAKRREHGRRTRNIVIVFAVLLGTFGLPSLLGAAFIDGPLLPRGLGVWTTSGREFWPYSATTFLVGAGLIISVLGLILLIRSRSVFPSAAAISALVLVFAAPAAGAVSAAVIWPQLEDATVLRLATTRPGGDGCPPEQSDCATLVDAGGDALWSASFDGNVTMQLFRGWRPVSAVAIPPDSQDSTWGSPVVIARGTVDDSVAVVSRGDGSLVGFAMPSLEQIWTVTDTVGSGLVPESVGGVLVGSIAEGVVSGWNPLSGVRSWNTRCPAARDGEPLTFGSTFDYWSRPDVVLMTCTFTTADVLYEVDPRTGAATEA